MKKYIGLLILLLFGIANANATQFIDTLSVGDFVIPDATSVFDVSSTTSGARPCPSMTTLQRDAIVAPATGLCVYNATDSALNIYDGAAWGSVGGGVDLTAPALQINNGMTYDRHSITLAESAGDITATIEKDGGGDIRFQLGGIEYTIDTTPAVTITLTEGASSSSPQFNYVYLDLGGGAVPTIQSSTTSPTGQFVWLATALLPDSATFLTEGAYHFQRWSDTTNFLNERGALSYEREKIRSLGATWLSGAASTLTIVPDGGAADAVTVDVTTGTIKQLHTQTFPAFTSPTKYYIANHPTTPYVAVADLNTQLTDALGNSMSSRRFSLVLWGSVNHNGESKLFVNLPNCSYSNNADALNDVDTCAVSTVPSNMRGTAFLIGRLTMRHRTISSGTWINLEGGTVIDDLRGIPVGTRAIGGGGGSGVYSDGVFKIFNSADDTKELVWDLATITSGNQRTLTMADRDMDLNTPSFTYTDFIAAVAPVYAAGRLFYDSTYDTLSYYNSEADITMDIGLETWIHVRNVSGVTIPDGSVVYITGASVQRPTIALARADDVNTCDVVGITTHSIENNSNGFVTVHGTVSNVDTSSFADGDIVYLSSSVAGELTTTFPLASSCAKKIGHVEYSNATTGRLLVNIETERHIDTGAEPIFLDIAFEKGESSQVAKSNASMVIAEETASPLRGHYSLKVTKDSGASRDGEYFTLGTFEVPVGYVANILEFKMQGLSDTNFDDDEAQVMFYDVDNTELITSIDGDGFIQATTFASPFVARFQTTATGTTYQIRLYVRDVTVDTWSLTLDDMMIGTQQSASGTVVTDWADYTPILSDNTSISFQSGRWRRVGDSIEVKGVVGWNGAGAGSGFQVYHPPGIVGITSNGNIEGIAQWTDTSGAGYSPMAVTTGGGTDSASFRESGTYNTWDGSQAASGDQLEWKYSLPISGWSSSTKMSTPFSGRDFHTKMYLSGNVAISTTSNVTVPLNAVYADKTGAADTVNNRINIQETGVYDISAAWAFGTDHDTNWNRIRVYRNSSTQQVLLKQASLVLGATNTFHASTTMELNSGDNISIWVDSSTDGSYTLNGAGIENTALTVSKSSGGHRFAKDAKVQVIARDASGQSVVNGNTITWDTVEVDTHNAFSAGIFTSPKSGAATVCPITLTGGVTTTVLQYYFTVLIKNGTDYGRYTKDISQNTASRTFSSGGCITTPIEIGDTLNIEFAETLPAVTLVNAAIANMLSIVVE